MQKNEIDIEAGAGVFRYFKTLPLSFESAIGELVDNSIASWIKNKKILPENFQLEIDISIDRGNNIITVFDNAFGISEEDYHRAFVVGKVPEDATSLNEFGAGMKVSAFWFGDKWTVRTKPINDKYQNNVNEMNSICVANNLSNKHILGKILIPSSSNWLAIEHDFDWAQKMKKMIWSMQNCATLVYQ